MFVPFKTQPGGSVWFLEIGAEGHESSDLAENKKKIIHHKNDVINHKMTISSIVIGLKFLFSTNSLAKLLSDNL